MLRVANDLEFSRAVLFDPELVDLGLNLAQILRAVGARLKRAPTVRARRIRALAEGRDTAESELFGLVRNKTGRPRFDDVSNLLTGLWAVFFPDQDPGERFSPAELKRRAYTK